MEKTIFEIKPGSFVFEKQGALARDICAEMIARFERYSDEQYPGRIGQTMQLDDSIKRSTDLVHWEAMPDWVDLAGSGLSGMWASHMVKAGGTCSFNVGDLGIAVGSAAAMAADFRIDNRIMYTAGKAAIELGMLGEDVKIAYGIPLAAKGKNPFFERG